MAKLGSAFVEIRAKMARYKQDLAKAKTATKRFATGMTGMLSKIGIGGVFAGGLGIAALVAGTKKLVGLAATQIDAERNLGAALKFAGDQSASALDDFKRYASELQKLTGIGDEVILTTARLGVTIGRVTGDQLKQMTKSAIGLAEIIGKDLNTAMLLLARAAQGDTAMLSRYGIKVDTTRNAQERFNEVLAKGTAGFKLAEERAQSITGKKAALAGQLADLGEVYGAKILPVVEAFTDAMLVQTEATKVASEEYDKSKQKVGIFRVTLAGAKVRLLEFRLEAAKAGDAIASLFGGIAKPDVPDDIFGPSLEDQLKKARKEAGRLEAIYSGASLEASKRNKAEQGTTNEIGKQLAMMRSATGVMGARAAANLFGAPRPQLAALPSFQLGPMGRQPRTGDVGTSAGTSDGKLDRIASILEAILQRTRDPDAIAIPAA